MDGAQKGSITIAFVREAVRAVARRGVDPAPYLAHAGIAPALLQSDTARVTPESFGTLWLSTAAAMDDEFFGLDARRMKVGSFATLCHFALGAADLREALARCCRFFSILLDDTVMRVEREAGEAVLRLAAAPRAPATQDLVFTHETLLVMVHGLLCWLVGRRIPIRRAEFAYARPAWSAEYQSVFSNELAFARPATRLVIAARLLDLPVVQTRDSARGFLRGAPANFIMKYRDEQSLAARVRRRLRGLAPEAWPSQEQLARELRLGASTLHRKLDQEGSSFRAIKDDLRRDLAIRYLAESTMSVGDIAVALGFAEPSAFRRAFKQWTGVPPATFRTAPR